MYYSYEFTSVFYFIYFPTEPAPRLRRFSVLYFRINNDKINTTDNKVNVINNKAIKTKSSSFVLDEFGFLVVALVVA